MVTRIAARWDALTDHEREDSHALLLCVALFLFHYAIYSWWYVEDAAISFAFAKNFSDGHGLVANIGGLRVEGFSNPSWTAFLTLWCFLGVTPFIVAKWMGAACGAFTFPFVQRLIRGVVPAGPVAHVGLIFLAVSPQFVEWAASGLESPLLVLLLAIGAVRASEGESASRPWSALVWWLLAVTRPEGVGYAALLGAVQLAVTVARRGPLEALRWAFVAVPLFLGPFIAWHAATNAYFGFPLPNTYYAKLGADRFEPSVFNGKGWRYVRGYLLESGVGFVLPAILLSTAYGRSGVIDRRVLGVSVAALVAVIAVVIPGLGFLQVIPHWPFTAPATRGALYPWLITYGQFEWFRFGVISGALALFGALSLRGPGASTRAAVGVVAGFALFFALYSGGDWMKGYRWFAPATIALAVWIAEASQVAYDALMARGFGKLRWWALAYVAGLPIAVGAGESVGIIAGPETMPYDVERRVMYMQGVQRRLHLDHVALMEVDMGAHMYWSGFDVVDMAGLVDVPMGHHKWEKPFVRQYVFTDRKPEFAHVHDSWAKKTKMLDHPEFRATYVEIDAFPTSQYRVHAGNHIRRDLMFSEDWAWDDDRTATFADGIALRGLYVPAPDVSGGLYVETGVSRGKKGREFRVVVFLAGNGRVVAWDAPPAYDWSAPTQWRSGDVVHGRHTFDLPNDLPEGTYDLGVVVLPVGDGAPLVAETTTGATDAPRYMNGEIRWDGAVHVVSREAATAAGEAGLGRVDEAAKADECEMAIHHWSVARRHLHRDDPWQEVAASRVSTSIARCFAERARRSAGDDAITAIREARRWSPEDVVVSEVGALIATGRARLADDAKDAKTIWPLLRDALVADPTRSDLYARAEAARDASLGLVKEAPVDVDGGGE